MNINLIIRADGDEQTLLITDDENDGAGPIVEVPFNSFAQLFATAEQLIDSGAAESLVIFAPSATVADRWATLINADGSLAAVVDADMITVAR